jgi:hypothetical protein
MTGAALNSPAVDCDQRLRMKCVAQIMSDEHRRIDEMRVALFEALTDRSITRARDEFDRYRAAISVHFALEEDVLFPEIDLATPDEKTEIERLVQTHDDFLDELVEMGEQLKFLPGEDFLRRLDGHATIFSLAESSEEALVLRAATAGAG